MTVRYVSNRAGVKSLLTSDGVRDEVYRRARRVHAAAGASDHNLYLDNKRFGERTRAAVVTATKKARVAQSKRQNLTRALDAARG